MIEYQFISIVFIQLWKFPWYDSISVLFLPKGTTNQIWICCWVVMSSLHIPWCIFQLEPLHKDNNQWFWILPQWLIEMLITYQLSTKGLSYSKVWLLTSNEMEWCQWNSHSIEVTQASKTFWLGFSKMSSNVSYWSKYFNCRWLLGPCFETPAVRTCRSSSAFMTRRDRQNRPKPLGTKRHLNPGMMYISYNRRKFRSETSDNMDSWKAEVRRVRREKIRRKKMQMCEKVGKSRNTVFFQWFGAPEGRKVGSLKLRVQSQLARWEMKNCTPLWREAHFEVKMYKTHQVRTTFGSCDVEKVHAVLARSTFWSQNLQNTPGPDHFWKLWCWKSARRCGAKHISKSKCTKHTILGPLLEVEMSKKCTPLWREAHFQVKSVKNWRSRTTFGGSDVEKVSKKCTPLWREAHFKVKSVKNCGFWAFFDVKMSKK